MKNRLTGTSSHMLIALLAGMLLSGCNKPDSSGWTCQQAPIMTRWAEWVEPGTTWTEYPRPQMIRSNWKNLNGLWDYTITPADAGMPTTWAGKILVPYPVESALSGVMQKVTRNDRLWYRRDLSIGAKLKDQRVILNFEAVDWETRVYIDGEEIGFHRGGYDPFSFDITSHLKPGVKHELVVSVWDPTTEGFQPLGKQTNNPQGIWYTPSSGIWQTVWLERVPENYITDYRVTTDIDNNSLNVTVQVSGDQPKPVEIRVLSDNQKLLATREGQSGETITIGLEEVSLWSPDDPYLYNLEVRLMHRNSVMDRVTGYFGMRKVSLGKDEQGITRILLNNRFVFQNGPLDQGFWPDGLNTPPSEEAMVYDLEMTKKMGFNMLRKHVKVEPRRFYYHTDRMGILVWQDMPSMFYNYAKLPHLQDQLEEARQNFESELTELVNDHINHPSIVIWVPFNEGWGQYDTRRIADYVKNLDPTRLVNNPSGWTDEGAGDIQDIHNYPEPAAPAAEENRAIVLGEFGGLGLISPGHMWQEENWGYEKMQDVSALLLKFEDFYAKVRQLLADPGLSAVVYTQTTDVETETNGLMTYDRDRVKMGVENVAHALRGIVPPRMKSSIREFVDSYQAELTSPESGVTTRYTLDGSYPDQNSPEYKQPIDIRENIILKAKSFWPEGDTSRTVSYEFKKVLPVPAIKAMAKPGLNVKFYQGTWNKLPDFDGLPVARQKTTGKVDLDFAPTSELFGLVFEGYLKVPSTGVYQLFLASDDGSRLSLDGQILIDHDGTHGTSERNASAPLEQGLHPFRLIYFQGKGGLGLNLSWEGPGLLKQEIGPEYYFIGG